MAKLNPQAWYMSVIPDFDGFFETVGKTSKKAGEQAGKDFSSAMEAAIDRHGRRVEAAQKRLDGSRAKHAAAVDRLKVAELKLQEVVAKGTASASQLARAEADVAAKRREVELKTKEADRAERSLKKASDELARAQNAANDEMRLSGKHLDAMGDKAEGAAGKLFGLTKRIGGIGLGLAGLGGGAAFFGDMLEQGRAMDTVLGSIGAVSGATAEQMAAVSARAKALGVDASLAGTSASSAAAAMLELTKGGLTVEQSMEAAKGSIQLAGAAMIEGGDAAAIQIAALSSFGLEADQASRVADVLVNTANASATGVTELAEALKYAAPGAGALGVSIEDTNTMLGLFANVGVKGSMAGTALAGSLNDMLAPSAQAQKAFAEMGFNALDAQGKFVGFASVSEQLREAQQRMGDEAFVAAAKVAFGEQGIKFATTAASNGAAGFEEMRAAMDRTGSAGETAGAKLAGINGSIEAFKNNLDAAKQQLYEALAPHMQQALDKINAGFEVLPGVLGQVASGAKATAEWFKRNESWVKPLAATVGVLAGAYGVLVMQQRAAAAGGFLKWGAELLKLDKARLVVTKAMTAAQAALNLVMNANPLGLIITAVAAVSAGLYVFFTRTETGRKAWRKFADGFMAFTDSAREWWASVKAHVVDNWSRAMENLHQRTAAAKDKIADAWGKLRGILGAPFKFFVEVVYNKAVQPAWNKVAGLVGMTELPKLSVAFASGGVLPGYTPGRDPYTFVEPRTGMTLGLSGGEAVMRPEFTRAMGTDWVDGANAAARMGGVEGVRRWLGGFADGGVIGSIVKVVKDHFPGMTITSTLRNTPDNHGRGLAVDFSDGTDSTPGMRKAAAFFAKNYGDGLLELIHAPFDHNVKNGRNVGDGFGFYGAATMNQHRNHVHVASPSPLGDPKTMVEQVAGFFGQVVESLRERVGRLVSGVMDPIGKLIPEFPGLIGGFPKAAFGLLKDAIVDFVGGRADGFAPAGGSVGSAESWREMAVAAMRRQGFNADDPAQVNAMLAQIMSESGGNPGIAQQIVDVNGTGEAAGVGLLQIIPGTFAAYRDPGLPDDRRDPWANMNAALRYYRARYGGDLTTMWGHGHGYARGGVIDFARHLGVPTRLYDQGGVLPHGGMSLNLSGKPELVLTNDNWHQVAALVGKLAELVPVLKDNVAAVRELITDAATVDVANTTGVAGVGERMQAWLGTGSVQEFADVLGQLPGLGEVTSAFSGVLSAHDQLNTAYAAQDEAVAGLREAYSRKLAAVEKLREAEANAAESSAQSQRKIMEAEKALEQARVSGDPGRVTAAEEKLKQAREDAAAAGARAESDRVDAVKQAQEEVAAAELGLVDARQAVVAAAAAAGHAEVAIAVQAASLVWDVVNHFVDAFLQARSRVWEAFAEQASVVRELTDMWWQQTQAVAKLRQQQQLLVLEQQDAAYQLRLAQVDVQRAQLSGVVSVAQAEEKLAAERERAARQATQHYDDLGWAYDRYRELERAGARARLEDALLVTPEILALEHEVNAAKLDAAIGEQQAILKTIDAVFKHQMAVLDLQDVQSKLAAETVKLARLSGQAFGMTSEEALTGERIAKLQAENARIRGKRDSAGARVRGFFGRLTDWDGDGKIFGFNNAWAQEADAYEAAIAANNAEIEKLLRSEFAPNFDPAKMAELDELIGKAAAQYAVGNEEAAQAILRGSFLGDAGRAREALEFQAQLEQIGVDRESARVERARLQAELEKLEQQRPVEDTVAALEAGKRSEQASAAAQRARSEAERNAQAALAEFEARQARQLAAGRETTVRVELPARQAFSRDEVVEILDSLNRVDSLAIRVDDLEGKVDGSPADRLADRRKVLV